MFENLGDKIIHRIPIINKLYKTLKEVIKVIFNSDSKTFKEVVMVPFPNKHAYCLGLLSRDSPAIITSIQNKLSPQYSSQQLQTQQQATYFNTHKMKSKSSTWLLKKH